MADPISAAVTAIISVGAKAGFALGLSKGAAIAASTFVVKTIGYAALSMTASALAAPSIDGYGGSPSEWRADPDAGLPFVVGEFGLAGNVIYPSDGYGADNRFTSIVTVFHCNGPVHQWGAYTLDDVSATFSSGVLTSGPSLWRGNIYLDRRDGYSTDTALASPSGLEGGASVPGWGSAYRLPGMACSMLTLRGDKKNKRFPTGEPSPFQVLKAPKWSYDPRLDDTYPGGEGPHRRNDRSTWGYSDDPYILALNFALGYWTGAGLGDGVLIGGFGNDWDNVDVAAFVAGANISEANGWKVGGMFRSTDDKHQVMSAFLQAGGGIYANPAGKISCVCRGAPKTSVATVTYEDLAGDIEIATDAPASEKVNSVIPRCPLPSFKYEMTALNEVSVSEYETLDRGKRQRRVDMPFVPATQQGSQLAAYAIVNSREPISGRVPLQPWMGELSPGDCFDFALPGLDLDGVKVMVLDREWNPGRQVWTVTFQSETDAKHAFALGLDPTPPTPDGLTPGSAFTVPVPDGSEWTASGGVVGTPGGPQQPGIIIEGGSEPNMIDGVWIEYALDDDGSPGSWVTWWKGEPSAANYVITGLDAGQTYWLGIRYRNTYGVWSDVDDRLILGPFETGALVATSAAAIGDIPADRVQAAIDEADTLAETQIREALDRRDRIRDSIAEVRDSIWGAFGTAEDFLVEVEEWTNQSELFSIAAAESATDAGNYSTAAAGYRAQALTYANNAGDSASAAAVSATAAAASETAAGNSATAAGGFAGTAETAATAAGDSASSASASATAAAASETAAGNSATAAGGFATDAETSASAAGDSAAAASTSATSAADSATAAGNSASAASGFASDAETAASAAGDSAAAASTSATSAADSATAAGNSASAASGFASDAETAATAAGDSASAASVSAGASAAASDAAGDSASAASGFAANAAASATSAGEEAAATLALRTEAQAAASSASSSATQATTASNNAASSATAASNSATAAGNSASAASSSAATADEHRAAAAQNAIVAAQFGASAKTDVADAAEYFTSDLAGLDYEAAAFTGWTEVTSGGEPVVYSTTSTISFGSRARFNPKPGRRYRVTALWRWTTGTVGSVTVGFRADPLLSGSAVNRWSTVTAGAANEWREASYEITADAAMAQESWRPVIRRTGNTGRIEVRALIWEDLSAFRAVGQDTVSVYSTAEESFAARLIQVSAGDAFAAIQLAARKADGTATSVLRMAAQLFGYGADFDNPRFFIDAVNNAVYGVADDGTTRTFELDFNDDGRLRIWKADGTLQFDSAGGGVYTAGIIENAATRMAFANQIGEFDMWGPGYGPGSSSNPPTRVFDQSVEFTDAEPGRPVSIFANFTHLINGGAFDWCYVCWELYRYGRSASAPSAGAGTSGKVKLLSSTEEMQGATAGRVLQPGTVTSGGAAFPENHSDVIGDQLPGTGDGDYDATGYVYLMRVRVKATALLSGTNPYENANSHSGTRTHKVTGANLLAIQLKR